MTRLTFQRLQVRNPNPDRPHVHTVPVGNGNSSKDVSVASLSDDQGVSVASQNGAFDVSVASHFSGCGLTGQLTDITREFDWSERESAWDQRTVFKVPVSKIHFASEGAQFNVRLDSRICIRRSDNKAGGGEWRAARFHSAQMIIC